MQEMCVKVMVLVELLNGGGGGRRELSGMVIILFKGLAQDVNHKDLRF